uniref:Uncharacterized protein n=1 Tax=Rhizophora mucronata TaxID=61149 RepID=A0A2P2J0W0_RHIMU
MSGISVSSPSSFYSLQSKTQTQFRTSRYRNALISVKPRISCSLNKNLKTHLSLKIGAPGGRTSLRCNSSSSDSSDSSSSGDSESKSVLDAFFLGKALAEALNERIESAVGEVLSMIGKLQAEQQKQIQEFQADVIERAKKAKQAATESQGLVSASSSADDNSSSAVSSWSADSTTSTDGSTEEAETSTSTTQTS